MTAAFLGCHCPAYQTIKPWAEGKRALHE